MINKLFISLFLVYASFVGAANITVKLTESPSQLYLASYYGKGVELVDSILIHHGEAVWHKDGLLPEGVYFLTVGPNNARFEFLIGADQDFTIDLNGLSFNQGRIVGAEESSLFNAYQSVVRDVTKSTKEKEVYTRSICESAPEGSVLKLILKAMLPSPVKEKSSSLLVVNNDDVYDYNALHFWDNYDLSDRRMGRTPFFAQRVDMFLRQVLPQRQDKIMTGVMPLLARAEQNNELLRIVTSTVLAFSNENAIMGIDALGYEVIVRYYLSGALGPLPDKQRGMLKEYVEYTKHCRVGHKGKEIRLDALDLEMSEVSLCEVKASYVLLVFWEPDCEFCKVVLPDLQKKIATKYYDKGLRIFAVNTQRDYDMWKNYIVEQQLFDWIHGYKAVGESDFMINYGVQGTPFMYLLDGAQNIIAKNVKLEHLDLMLSKLYASGSIY